MCILCEILGQSLHGDEKVSSDEEVNQAFNNLRQAMRNQKAKAICEAEVEIEYELIAIRELLNFARNMPGCPTKGLQILDEGISEGYAFIEALKLKRERLENGS